MNIQLAPMTRPAAGHDFFDPLERNARGMSVGPDVTGRRSGLDLAQEAEVRTAETVPAHQFAWLRWSTARPEVAFRARKFNEPSGIAEF